MRSAILALLVSLAVSEGEQKTQQNLQSVKLNHTQNWPGETRVVECLWNVTVQQSNMLSSSFFFFLVFQVTL